MDMKKGDAETKKGGSQAAKSNNRGQ
jgi:hypothetical protein